MPEGLLEGTRRWTIQLALGELGVRPLKQEVLGPDTERIEVIALSDLPAIIEQAKREERELLREAIYQELTAENYLPDHFLVDHLDNAEAALEPQDEEER